MKKNGQPEDQPSDAQWMWDIMREAKARVEAREIEYARTAPRMYPSPTDSIQREQGRIVRAEAAVTDQNNPQMPEQPEPQPNNNRPIWDMVCEDVASNRFIVIDSDNIIADMRQRDQIGRQRYGTALQAHNGRNAMQDAYEELLDASVYLKQTLVESRDDTTVEYALVSFMYVQVLQCIERMHQCR